MNIPTSRYATPEGVRADIRWLYEMWVLPTKERPIPLRDDPRYTAMNSDPGITKGLDYFHARLHTAAGSNEALRLTGYTGCVFAPKRCLAIFPYVCCERGD